MDIGIELKVFVEPDCRLCDRALGLASEMRERFRELRVEVVDLSRAGVERPDDVFAVPTFVLNGRVLSLGNPRRSRLVAAVEAVIEKGRAADGE